MNILKKVDGTYSKLNIFNLTVFVLGVVELVKPFVPQEYLVYVGLAVSIVNLYLRTFQSSGEAIEGFAKG
ncbi:MAG TPA: hypothetical protein VJ742_11410 [Nitrososphaera sp.]|nr:hypothetical protein [Nitrososphaera sp.]